jgi:hypothetical protein
MLATSTDYPISLYAVLAPCIIRSKNRHCEKRLIKEQRRTHVELAREGLLDEGWCVGAQERSQSGKVLKIEKTEPKGSAPHSRGKACYYLGSDTYEGMR